MPFVICLIAGPLTVQAQTEWVSEGAWWPATLDSAGVNSGHGIAVDPDGKVWFQPFSASDSVQVPGRSCVIGGGVPTDCRDDAYRSVRVIYVFNPDGTDAAISPIKFLTGDGTGTNQVFSDTLGGYLRRDATTGEPIWEGKSGRGLRTDHNGNILRGAFDFAYRVNYQTGAGMNRIRFDGVENSQDYCGMTAPAADAAGNTYLAPVCPFANGPISVLDESFNFVENVTDQAIGFSRSFEVTDDGLFLIWFGYTNHEAIIYGRPDEFSPWDSLGVSLPGMDSESLTKHPVTGDLWVSAGSPNDAPNRHPTVVTNYLSQSWYSFDIADVTALCSPCTAKEFLTWDVAASGNADGRPRGLAFSPDGMMAYATQFNQVAPSIIKYSPPAVAIERTDGTIPEQFTLKQNYPNPFNPTTTIEFEMAAAAHATLRIFDVLGRQVSELVNEPLAAGAYSVVFDASDLSSGTYVYVLQTDSYTKSANMTILK